MKLSTRTTMTTITSTKKRNKDSVTENVASGSILARVIFLRHDSDTSDFESDDNRWLQRTGGASCKLHSTLVFQR